MFLYRLFKALRTVGRRSRDLAEVTGIDAKQIKREITRRQITPGEWAEEHGLDPITFRPLS